MDLVSYKSRGLEYFEAKYGYMSDKAIALFRERFAKYAKKDEEELSTGKPNQYVKSGKYRPEFSSIMIDMRLKGYTPLEIANYLNGYQYSYEYTRKQISMYFYQEHDNPDNEAARLSATELNARRSLMRKVHNAGRYQGIELSPKQFRVIG